MNIISLCLLRILEVKWPFKDFISFRYFFFFASLEECEKFSDDLILQIEHNCALKTKKIVFHSNVVVCTERKIRTKKIG
jgi:hypothetical protein